MFKTRNNVRSWLDWDISFFYPYFLLAKYVVFVVGTIEDCIHGVQNVVRVLKKGPRSELMDELN